MASTKMIRLMTVWETGSMALFASSFLLAGHLAVPAHQAGGDDVVLEIDLEAALLGEHELQEVEHVARVERGGVGRHQRGQVGLAHERDAMLDDDAPRLGQRAV